MRVNTERMLNDGFDFFIDEHRKHVWVTYHVPPEYIEIESEAEQQLCEKIENAD